jgi:hypothetical protein
MKRIYLEDQRELKIVNVQGYSWRNASVRQLLTHLLSSLYFNLQNYFFQCCYLCPLKRWKCGGCLTVVDLELLVCCQQPKINVQLMRSLSWFLSFLALPSSSIR